MGSREAVPPRAPGVPLFLAALRLGPPVPPRAPGVPLFLAALRLGPPVPGARRARAARRVPRLALGARRVRGARGVLRAGWAGWAGSPASGAPRGPDAAPGQRRAAQGGRPQAPRGGASRVAELPRWAAEPRGPAELLRAPAAASAPDRLRPRPGPPVARADWGARPVNARAAR